MNKLRIVDGNYGHEKAYEKIKEYLTKNMKSPEPTPILFV